MIAQRTAAAIHCLLGLLLMMGCSHEPSSSIRLISVQADQKTDLFTYKFPEIIFKTDSGSPITIPVQEGDFISSDDMIVIVRKGLPDMITIHRDDFGTYVNGQLFQIRIDTSTGCLSWMAQLTDAQIKQVKCLWFDSPLQESLRHSLQRISRDHPGVDLVLNFDSSAELVSDLSWLASHFKPRALMVNAGLASMGSITNANFPNLEFMILGIETADASGPLPSLPALKDLFVFIDKSHWKIPNNFFDENPQLEKLTIMGGGPFIEATPPWSGLSHLKELNVNMDSLLSYRLALHHPELQTVIMQRAFDLDSIQGLKNLTWLSMDTQNGLTLDQLPVAFPSVTLLDLQNRDTLQEFGSLKHMSHLQYLVISDKTGVDTTLYGLTGLKYLSIPEKIMEDSARFHALKQALPATIVSPNSGVCMGTGWLLLLLPLVGIFLLVQRYARANAPHHAS